MVGQICGEKIAISYLMENPQIGNLNKDEERRKKEQNRGDSNKPKKPIRTESFALVIDALCSRCFFYFVLTSRKTGTFFSNVYGCIYILLLYVFKLLCFFQFYNI
jgi:hypothetical protein